MYIYIILCSDDSYYIGVTNNIDRGFEEHQSGIHPESYTFSIRPLELVYIEEFDRPNAAIAREKQPKRWSRKKKEALVSGNENSLKTFSKKSFCK